MPKTIKTADYCQIGDMLIRAQRFEQCSKPDPTPGSSCLLWTGARHRQGYGMMGYIRASDRKKSMNVVHRLVKIHELGRELSRDEFVVHSCSNPLCINPQHLLLGDAQLRNQVMHANGRASPNIGRNKVRGVLVRQNRQYRYSEEEMLWIRHNTIAAIAERYSLTRARAATLRWGMRKGFKWLK